MLLSCCLKEFLIFFSWFVVSKEDSADASMQVISPIWTGLALTWELVCSSSRMSICLWLLMKDERPSVYVVSNDFSSTGFTYGSYRLLARLLWSWIFIAPGYTSGVRSIYYIWSYVIFCDMKSWASVAVRNDISMEGALRISLSSTCCSW